MRPWAAAVVVVHAAVQTALVLGDPVPALSWGFAAAAVVSAVALVIAAGLLAVLAPARGGRAAVLARVLAVAVVAVAASLLSPLLVPVVLAVGCPVLVGATGAFRAFPLRSALLLVGTLVLAALSWVGALLAGFFVGGPVGALVTWLWFGAVAALLLRWWATLSGDRGEVRVGIGADPDAPAVAAEQSSGHGEHD